MAQVAGKMVSLVLRALEAQGLPTGELVARLGVEREALESGRQGISWRANCELLERVERLCGGPDGLIALGRTFNRVQILGPLQRMMSFALGPLQLYKLVARWQGPASFSNISSELMVEPDGKLRIDVEIEAGSLGSLQFLRLTQGALESAPRIIGLGPSIVQAELEPRRGRYAITPPPSPALLARLARVTELFGSSRSAIDHLAEQHEELRRSLVALKASEERFRRLAENAGDMIAEWREDGRCVYVSPNVERLLGCTADEFLADPAALLHPDEREQLLTGLLRRVELGGQGHATFRLRRPGGEWRWFDSTSSVFTTASGAKRVVTVSRDVTERRELERQLRHAQKMEAIGQLAGGIAHDFNNLLTVITGYGSQLRDAAPAGSTERREAQQILDAAARAEKLTRQLLAFSVRFESEPRGLDLNEVVGSLESMTRRVIGEHIELVVELAPELSTVRADPGQLEQVVMNLVVNARDAMPAGGRLEIRTSPVELPSGHHLAGLEAPPGRYARLEVSDTGEGMSAETQSRIFEPFFTTKQAGRGSGLGLAMVYGIVRRAGGYVTVTSAPGEGATFAVHLPVVAGRPEPRYAGDAEGRRKRGSETILLVEDEPLVRSVTRQALERHGYRVLATESAQDALRVANGEREIDLLLSDVVMPGIGGRELAERLRRRRPRLKVLLVSGYPDERPALDAGPAATDTLVRKPFTPEQIADAVRRALDG